MNATFLQLFPRCAFFPIIILNENRWEFSSIAFNIWMNNARFQFIQYLYLHCLQFLYTNKAKHVEIFSFNILWFFSLSIYLSFLLYWKQLTSLDVKIQNDIANMNKKNKQTNQKSKTHTRTMFGNENPLWKWHQHLKMKTKT